MFMDGKKMCIVILSFHNALNVTPSIVAIIVFCPLCRKTGFTPATASLSLCLSHSLPLLSKYGPSYFQSLSIVGSFCEFPMCLTRLFFSLFRKSVHLGYLVPGNDWSTEETLCCRSLSLKAMIVIISMQMEWNCIFKKQACISLPILCYFVRHFFLKKV